MEFIIVPVEQLKEFDTEWEYRRKSNDGTKAIIHKELYDELVPQVMTMDLQYDEQGNPVEQERKYPFPIVSAEELDGMAEFKAEEPKTAEEPKAKSAKVKK